MAQPIPEEAFPALVEGTPVAQPIPVEPAVASARPVGWVAATRSHQSTAFAEQLRALLLTTAEGALADHS